jgi:small-conductance mechanosensitive channel
MSLFDILNYPIIGDENFIISPINIVVFVCIYMLAKVGIKYLKRYFKIKNLAEKELNIEGKRIAVWKLTKQIVYVFVIFICILSLRINNGDVYFADILAHEFYRSGPNGSGDFHFAVYHLFLIAAIVVITRLLVNFAQLYVHRSAGKSENVDQGTRFVRLQLAKYLLYSIAVIVVFRSFGATIGLFLGAFAALGVGLALGAQFMIRDYMSGLLLLFERSIKVGDVIEIETPGTADNFICTVEKIHLRTSQVKTTFDKVLVVPNSKLTHESVINWSLGEKITKFSISVTVAFGTDTEMVQKILVNCATNHPKTIKHLDYEVRLRRFTNEGLELELQFYAEQSFFIDRYKSDIRYAIDHEFRKAGIKVPYSQHDVHIVEKIPSQKS